MKYSDSVKAILLATIDDLATDPQKYAKRPGRDFTRNRKLGFKQLLLMLLTMEGECIREEIYTYFGRDTAAPSKAAFYKQIHKLKDGVLRCLLLAFNQKLKKHLFHGKYQLIACDGSALDIFRNPFDPDTFFPPSGMSPKGYNQAYINACYSILDRRFTDLTDKKTEGILGYSLEGMREIDVHVERILSRSQSKKKREHPELAERYRHVCSDVPMDYLTDARCEYGIALRVIRVETAPGSFVNLITNLPDHEFDIDDLKELYHLRWDQENAYRDIKYPLCLKALHSKKYEYIVQEIWARALLHNFCSEIALNVEIEQKERKYEYQVNDSQAVKTCRDFLRIHDGISTMDVEGLVASSIEAIRPGRTFPRQKRFKIPMSFCYRN